MEINGIPGWRGLQRATGINMADRLVDYVLGEIDMKPMEADRITWSVHIACLFEVSADKPGNVTWGKDFWDTRFVDFMASAMAVGPAFRNAAETPVGEIIYQAVRDTGSLANTNTNLGMILLLAPLARAAALRASQRPARGCEASPGRVDGR